MEEEHFGISVIEAMNNECIPIVADRGFPTYLIDDNYNGYIFDNKTELCNILNQIMSNKYEDIKYINTSRVLNKNKEIVKKYTNISLYKSNLLKILFNM